MVSKRKVKYKLVWRLAALLGERKIFNYAELQRMLKDVGVDISSVQISRLVRGEPEKYNRALIEGLMSVLDCTLDELIATTVAGEDEPPVVDDSTQAQPAQKSAETQAPPKMDEKPGKKHGVATTEFERIAGPKLVPFPPPKK